MAYSEVRLDSAAVHGGESVPKLPLMVWLRPHEPWRGSVVFSASSSPFRDGSFLADGFAHRRLLDVLCRTLASDERMVIHRAGIEGAAPLPELSSASRLWWRAFCIALIPAVLAGIALWRGVLRSDDAPLRSRSWGFNTGLPLRALAGLAIVIAIITITGATSLRADLTRAKLNELAEPTRRIAHDATGDEAVDVTLIFSPPQQMPPEMRLLVRNLRNTLREFRRAGANITITTISPGDRDVEDRGVQPIRITTHDEGVTTVRTIYSAVELRGHGRSELLHFPDRTAFENAEFRIAFALWRLHTGRRPHIAFASDVPRLSAAEAYHDFQQRNLLAPTGTDVYSFARAALERLDFRVTHVNPRSPELPDDIDLIVWMQPRRSILPMLEQTVQRLHEGVPVMIAAQHFNMQSRQYRGAGFEMVYWPQPQVVDLHRTYFPDLGIELVHEVLLDEMKTALPLETQVNLATGERAYEQQTSTLPFLIRAVSPNFSRHLITQGLGDQAMPFAAYIRLDEDRLREHRIRATTLMTTSERAWTYDWTGGWLPHELLAGPPRDEDDRRLWLGRLPLAVLLEGRFPKPAAALLDRRVDEAGDVAFDPAPGQKNTMLLIGCSEMFKNSRLLDAEFRADHLLMNAVTALALDADLAHIAGHRRAAPGFDYIEPEERLRWRAIVLGSGPAAMLAFGLFWVAVRSRISVVVRSELKPQRREDAEEGERC
jgi:hypothetical protein